MKTLAQTKWFAIVEPEGADEVVVADDEVLVVAVDAEGRILLIEEPSSAFAEPTLLLPGGMVEGDEAVEATGLRELREETGFGAAKTTLLARLRPWSKYLRVTSHVVVAEGLYAAPLKAEELVPPVLKPKTPAEIDALIASGGISDARVIAAFSLWRQRVAR